MKKLVIPAIVALSLTACNDDSSFSKNKEGTTIGTVNGSNIIQEDVNANLAALPANVVAGREGEIRQSIVDRLVEQELVLQAADKANIKNDKEFNKIYDNVVRNLAYNFMINKAVAASVSDEALKKAYEENKAKYKYETVKARHILLKTEANAKTVIKELKNGKNFVVLAKTQSTGPSAANGGDLGWFKKTDMVPAFATAAFALEKGAFTKAPVQTQFGWHVILVEDKKADNIASFEMVVKPLQQQLTNNAAKNYVESLKEGAKISITAVEEPKAVKKAAEAPATK